MCWCCRYIVCYVLYIQWYAIILYLRLDHALYYIASSSYELFIVHQSTIRAKILHQNYLYFQYDSSGWCAEVERTISLFCDQQTHNKQEINFWNANRLRTSKHNISTLFKPFHTWFIFLKGAQLYSKMVIFRCMKTVWLWWPGTWLSQNLSQSFFEKKLYSQMSQSNTN